MNIFGDIRFIFREFSKVLTFPPDGGFPIPRWESSVGIFNHSLCEVHGLPRKGLGSPVRPSIRQ